MHTFTDLTPWWKYSVTICGGLQLLRISVNKAACTCGDDHHIPGRPVLNCTLPEGTNCFRQLLISYLCLESKQ